MSKRYLKNKFIGSQDNEYCVVSVHLKTANIFLPSCRPPIRCIFPQNNMLWSHMDLMSFLYRKMQEPCQRTILNVTISCIDDSLCCDVHCNKFDLTDGSVQDVFKIDADFQDPRLLKSGDKATAVYSKCIQGYTFKLASNF